jgi:sulfur-oxidizing protein SoxZ
MSKTSRTSIAMPAQAKKDSIIEIRAIAQHDMETGYRYTDAGRLIPRDIIRFFTCQYNGTEIFRAEFHPGTGANPLIIFTTIATESGTLQFEWRGDDGYEAFNQSQITVT